MSFFRNKNRGKGEVTIEMNEQDTAIQATQPTDINIKFWIDTDE